MNSTDSARSVDSRVRFTIGTPLLSRGTADRSEDLRHADRLAHAWRHGRLLVIDPSGRVATDEDAGRTRLRFGRPADLAPDPVPDAVLLGRLQGADPVDVWSVDGAVEDGRGLRELGPLLGDTDAGLLTTAVAVSTWHRAGAFCPRCGRRSTVRPDGWARICPEGHEEFPRTDPAVIVLVHDGADRMVLARQSSWPPGRVSVLAGFVEAGESLESTVLREIAEEVGLQVRDIDYLGSQPWPFPRSLMVGFAARADAGAPLVPRDGEIEDAQWVDRATVRRVLAAGGEAEGIALPGEVSIARRLIEGWAESG